MGYDTYNYQPYTSGYNTVNTPYQPQQRAAPMQAQQQTEYEVRNTNSREEAFKSLVDYFSPGVIFADFTHGYLYFKRFNSRTGSFDFMDFKYTPPAAPVESESIDPAQFVTRKEFDEFARRMQAIREVDVDAV